ncbi:phosphatidate cytidylyltransferase [Rickettsia endosymbiont of Orchestes rusci]|uniref:phosphatidate cytidylyltransferase n=1 Tax=Rickettsia endosymbiont of Orchestes rusci TaxID=3066250 RepID=UPI00313CD3CC
MLLRILSAMVLGPVFIVAILWLKPLFYVLMILVAIGMLCEWYDMTSSSLLHLLTGLVVIPLPIISLMLLQAGHNNQWLILLYFVIIWSVDTFAMIGGKIIGGPRLAFKISPKKTWSGLISGIISAGFITVFVNYYFFHSYFSRAFYLFIISCSLALIAQLSDLFVSYFKRKFNIKDSGTVIPGHGGVLDRFDSIILTAPILLFLYLYDYF